MSEKMRVLQINKLYAPVTGGVERVVQQIAEGLNECAQMQVLVCQQKGGATDETLGGVAVHRSASLGVVKSMPISFPFLKDVRKLSKEADILHLHMPFPLGDLACLRSGFKGPIVVSWHSDVVRQERMMRLYGPIMHKMLRRADRIIVATQGHIDGSKYLGAYSEKCVIIPYGVDGGIFDAGRAFLDATGPSGQKNAVDFLFIGRLVYYKGCEVLIDAFAKMQNKNSRLTLVGQGPLKEQLEEQARSAGVSERIFFTNEVSKEELQKQYESCDVFVLPSVQRSEAFGLVQIEAMSYGKPVINTKLDSGVPYVSVHGITGLTVPPGDAEALATAMDRLAFDPALRQQYGKNARVRVEEEYNIKTMLQKIYLLYNELIEERHKEDEK